MTIHFPSFLQLALAIVAPPLLLVTIPYSAWSQQTSISSHTLTKNCVSDSGILLCTECREQAGLWPILTPGNSDLRANALSQLVNTRLENRKTLDSAIDNDENEDDEDDNGEKKRKQSKKKSNQKSKTRSNDEKRKNPLLRKLNSRAQGMSIPSRHQQPGLPLSMMQQHAGFSPVHPEIIELLQNMNRTLKSIESMMRQESERQQPRPSKSFAPQWNPRSQMNTPQPSQPHWNGPAPDQPPHFQDRKKEGSLRNDGPRNDGPRRIDGPVYDGLQ